MLSVRVINLISLARLRLINDLNDALRLLLLCVIIVNAVYIIGTLMSKNKLLVWVIVFCLFYIFDYQLDLIHPLTAQVRLKALPEIT